MLIFVFGDATYSSLEKLSTLRAFFIEKHDPSGMNVAEFVAPKASLGEVMSAIQAPPFLGVKRLVIVKGLCRENSTKGDAKPWIEALERVPESTIVILWDDVSVKKMARHALVKAFGERDGVHQYSFEALTGGELFSWTAARAKELGLSADRRILEVIVSRVGTDLWQLANELDKLAAYANGQVIDKFAVDQLVRTNPDDQMFALMDAISVGSRLTVLSLLSLQREFGTSDQQLFAMLSRQVRRLLSVRDLLDETPSVSKQEVADALSLHPFVAQKTLSQARRFSKEQLLHLQTLLYRLDRLVKLGRLNAELAVDRAIVGALVG